jgi:serine/threonine protein kinase
MHSPPPCLLPCLSVYKAHDLNLNRHVAVKVLRREKANEVNTRRFLREAELNGLLSNNPYVVTVHDFGRTRGGTLFIVMELLKGRPLNELLDERIAGKQPFSVLECIHLLSPVLRGLHAAHTHKPPIVHRDLKPDNIWIGGGEGECPHNSSCPYQPSARPSDHLTKVIRAMPPTAVCTFSSLRFKPLHEIRARMLLMGWFLLVCSSSDYGFRHRHPR